MSYHRPLRGTHGLHPTEPRVRRASKGGGPARSPHKTPASRGHSGMMGQSFARLASFVPKKGLSVAGGAIAAIGILVWFLPTKAFTVGDLLQQQGYWEIVPPAEFHVPGTINTIEVRSDGKIELHPTCKIDSALLDRMTRSSRTIDRTLAERLNKGVDVSGRMKELVSIGMGGNKARRINMSLLNSSILNLADEDLILVRREVIKGACQEAIVGNINNGAKVCQTREAFRGDLVYDITYEQGISADEKAKLTADAAAKLGFDLAQGQTDQMIGKGLIYGVKLAPDGILLNTPNAKPTDCQASAR